MTSQIDPTLPVTGTPTTASVRSNFQVAHDEISALQTAAGAITATQVAISPAIGTLGANVQAALTTVNSNFALLAGPVFQGDPQAPTPATGDNDTSIATTAFVQTAVAPALHNVGRNLLHNGLFNVAQRGVGPWTTAGSFTADRWRMWFTNGSMSTSVYTNTDSERAGIGDEAMQFCLLVSVTGLATAGSGASVVQAIENVRRLAGKTVTVSFFGWGGTAGLKLGAQLQQYFGTGGSPSATVTTPMQAVTLATAQTPTRYSMTFAVPSVVGKSLGTNFDHLTNLVLSFSDATAGSPVGVQTGQIAIWGVQLEVGSIASPLEKIDIQTDVANCQRYYVSGAVSLYAYNIAGAYVTQLVSLPVPMRASPTIVPSLTPANLSGVTMDSQSYFQVRAVALATATGACNVIGTFTASADI